MSSTRSHVKVSQRIKRFWYLMGLIRDPSNIQSYLTETPVVCSKSPTAPSHSARHPLRSPQWFYDRQTQWIHESVTAEHLLKIFTSELKVMLRLNLKPWIQIVHRFMLQHGFKSPKNIFSKIWPHTSGVFDPRLLPYLFSSCTSGLFSGRTRIPLPYAVPPCRWKARWSTWSDWLLVRPGTLLDPGIARRL